MKHCHQHLVLISLRPQHVFTSGTTLSLLGRSLNLFNQSGPRIVGVNITWSLIPELQNQNLKFNKTPGIYTVHQSLRSNWFESLPWLQYNPL